MKWIWLLLPLFSCATSSDRMSPPVMQLKEVALADATLSDSVMIFRVEIHNPNSDTMDISHIHYKLKLGGKPAAESQLDPNLRIRADSSVEYEIPVRIDFVKVFDSIMVAMHDKVTDYELDLLVRSGGFTVPFRSRGKAPVLP